MPSTRRHSYDLNFKLKIVAEAEAVNNNREIAREYSIFESMVRIWRNQQRVLFSGELRMTAKRASMGRYRPKDPELDQQLARTGSAINELKVSTVLLFNPDFH